VLKALVRKVLASNVLVASHNPALRRQDRREMHQLNWQKTGRQGGRQAGRRALMVAWPAARQGGRT
jgi:hypothetical protein